MSAAVAAAGGVVEVEWGTIRQHAKFASITLGALEDTDDKNPHGCRFV